MDDLPRPDPTPPSEPTAVFIISFQPREPGKEPRHLLEDIVEGYEARVNPPLPSEARTEQPLDNAFVRDKESNPSSNSFLVEMSFQRGYDQHEAEERDRASASPPVAKAVGKSVGTADASSSQISKEEPVS